MSFEYLQLVAKSSQLFQKLAFTPTKKVRVVG